MAELLLDKLSEKLDPELALSVKSDPNLRKVSEQYLVELLNNSELFTTASASDGPSLVQEIAELDCLLRNADLALAAVTNKNRDLIIDISKDLNQVKHTLSHDFASSLESLNSALNNNSDFVLTPNDKLTASIAINNSFLANIDSVLDLLELPTLCKLCVRQGNYQEALDISVLAQTLNIRFPKLPVFYKIQRQVEAELKTMVAGLIKLLNTNLKQKNTLKIFHILNKLDLSQYSQGDSSVSKFSTADPSVRDHILKRLYLNARYKLITNELATLDPLLEFNVLTYLKRYIEIFREYVLSSLSTFQAVFGNGFSGTDRVLVNQFTRSLAILLCEKLGQHFGEVINSADPEQGRADCDGLVFQIIYLCKSLDKHGLDFALSIAWELCYKPDPIILESVWLSNMNNLRKMQEG